MPSLTLPEYGKHVVFLGATGSGKTVLAERMLSNFDNIFAIDTQDALEIEAKVLRNPKSLGLWLKIYHKIRYVPKMEYMNSTAYNYIFKVLLDSSKKRHKKSKIIYIDEIYHLGYGASFPNWLPRSITTARQRGISFWISTQRPRNIPLPVLTEASKIYVFYLNKEEDIDFISGFARTDKRAFRRELMEQKDDYSFFEIDARKGTWVKYPKIKYSRGDE